MGFVKGGGDGMICRVHEEEQWRRVRGRKDEHASSRFFLPMLEKEEPL